MAQLVIDRERGYYFSSSSLFVYRVINGIIGLIEAALGLRLLLIFFGANGASAFVSWVYAITDALVTPFMFAFPSFALGPFLIDIATILAMIAYSIVGWLLARLLSFVFDTVR